jgi:hypothetical protein
MASKKDQINEQLQKAIKKSQWSGAIVALEQLSRLEPANPIHRLRMGDYHLKLNQKDQAIVRYFEAAESFVEAGFLVKALAAYKMVLRLDPQHADAHKKMQDLHNKSLEQSGRFKLPPTLKPAEPPAMPQPPDFGDTISPERFEPAVTATAQEPSPPDFGNTLSPEQFEVPASPPPADFVIERTLYTDEVLPVEAALSGEITSEEAVSRSLSHAVPLFSNLTQQEFNEVVEKMVPYQYPTGYRIVIEGEKGDSLYIISSGGVKVVTSAGGRELVLAELGENEFFGEVGFLTGRPRTATILSTTDTEILELNGEQLRAIVEKYPHVKQVLERFYAARLSDTIKALKSEKRLL